MLHLWQIWIWRNAKIMQVPKALTVQVLNIAGSVSLTLDTMKEISFSTARSAWKEQHMEKVEWNYALQNLDLTLKKSMQTDCFNYLAHTKWTRNWTSFFAEVLVFKFNLVFSNYHLSKVNLLQIYWLSQKCHFCHLFNLMSFHMTFFIQWIETHTKKISTLL